MRLHLLATAMCLAAVSTQRMHAQSLPDAHGLLVWQLHQSAGEATIADLQSTADGRAFLHALEGNDTWMHELA